MAATTSQVTESTSNQFHGVLQAKQTKLMTISSGAASQIKHCHKRKSTEPRRLTDNVSDILRPLPALNIDNCHQRSSTTSPMLLKAKHTTSDQCRWNCPGQKKNKFYHVRNDKDSAIKSPLLTTTPTDENGRSKCFEREVVNSSGNRTTASTSCETALVTRCHQFQKCTAADDVDDQLSMSSSPAESVNTRQRQQRNYKNMSRERRMEANARERSRVHTISAAFEELRRAVPSYSCHQKLSKLAILKVACSYILALANLNQQDYSRRQDSPSFAECVDLCTSTIQSEGKPRKRKMSP